LAKQSAGLLLYRTINLLTEVLLVHPGGPFFRNKDIGVWSIPKGEFTDGEDPLAAAHREVSEELGISPSGEIIELTPVFQKNGKKVLAWAIESDFDPSAIVSNTFAIEWPPRSGKTCEFPEVDRAGWFSAAEAKIRIIGAQAALIDELMSRLG
jgi:predicted NUDIX family NTP pyrophosphohydrolase